MYSKFGIVRSYTIEANYNMCNRLNTKIYKEPPLNERSLSQYLNSKDEMEVSDYRRQQAQG